MQIGPESGQRLLAQRTVGDNSLELANAFFDFQVPFRSAKVKGLTTLSILSIIVSSHEESLTMDQVDIFVPYFF